MKMLDWLSSKFVMMIAGVLILTSAITLIGVQKDGLEEFELKQIANKIADAVNSIGQTLAETKSSMEFEKKAGAQSLPLEVGGKGYTVNMSQSSVVVTQGSKGFSARFSVQAHYWNPNLEAVSNKSHLEEMDCAHRYLSLNSSSRFVIEHKIIMMEECNEFHTFVY